MLAKYINMNKAYTNFKNLIALFGLSENEFKTLITYCEQVQFKKGENIMKEGEKQSKLYFLYKGIVRYCVMSNDGELHTYGFRMENSLITGYAQHNKQNEYRAEVSIECLEDCDLIEIPFIATKYMESNSPEAHKVARYLSETHIIELVRFIKELDTKSISERYLDLEKTYPGLHQRVTQQVIASYLRTTPVHLSRIKKARIKS
jgi:CRP-like cAMP-binding protein